MNQPAVDHRPLAPCGGIMAGNGSSSSLESGHVDAYAPLRFPEEQSADEAPYLERFSSGGTAKGAYEPFYRRMVRRLSGMPLNPGKSRRASAIDVISEAGQEHPLSSQSIVAASDSAGNAPATSGSEVAASEVTLPQVQSPASAQSDAPMYSDLARQIAQIAEQQKRPREEAAAPWFPIDTIVCCSSRRKDKSTRGQECFPGISEVPPDE